MVVGKHRIWALLCTVVWGYLLATAGGTEKRMLFQNGKTDYRIVVSSQASASERHAASELQYYLNKISGATFPLGETIGAKNIYIGYRTDMAEMANVVKPDDNSDTFVYDVKGESVYIYGGRDRGTMYGVYAFLENEFGVRWYAQDCTKIPKLDVKLLSDILRHTESPAFRFRCLLAYPINISHELTAHFRLNEVWFSKAAERADYGTVERYWGAHTMGSHFVPAKDYFHSHPEYFALWEGKRISDGQVCLSNADVLKICISKMLDVMQQNPGYLAYELSQNDNSRFCTCKRCVALENKYGGHSGAMIWFVNQVAHAVKDKFPDKYVGTMAYQYTLQPPTNIRPAENVMLRLSSSLGCFAHPLKQGCSNQVVHSDEVVKALEGWGKLCNNIYVWDYAVNFSQYTAPYPNFHVLAENIRLFSNNHVVGLMEQGQRSSEGGEFAELKMWVLSKLMWNPSLDSDSLAKEFITNYYGKAAPMIEQYFQRVRALSNADKHFRIVFSDFSKLYDRQFIADGKRLLSEAEKVAGRDTMLQRRVKLVKLQLLTAEVLTQPENAIADGSWNEYQKISREYKVRPSEQKELETYIKEQTKQMPQNGGKGTASIISASALFLMAYQYIRYRRNRRKEEKA